MTAASESIGIMPVADATPDTKPDRTIGELTAAFLGREISMSALCELVDSIAGDIKGDSGETRPQEGQAARKGAARQALSRPMADVDSPSRV